MREIKFRCWDKEQRRIFNVYGFDGDHVYEHTYNDYTHSVHPRNICELIEYTGLKDKNGKEIYESDKVRYATGDPDNPFIVEEVYFGEGAFYPVCTQPGETFEVIGNVYESNTKSQNY